MNLKFTVALATITALAAVVPALALQDEDKPSKIGIRVAIVAPMDSNLKDLNSTWMGPAFDYHLKLDKEGRPERYLSMSMIRSGDRDAYEKASMTPITYTIIKRKRINENQLKYMGYGGGVAAISLRDSRGSGSSAEYIDGSTYLPELHAVYGREFKSYFAEVQISYMPKWKGDNWNFIGLNLGTRFAL